MSRIFAIIPAAGLSRRMGQPKLLLPLGDGTVLGSLLTTLSQTSRFAATILVARRSDTAVAGEATRLGATVIQPEADPPTMRDSIELALHELAARFTPVPSDGWLLIPADFPLVKSRTLNLILDQWDRSSAEILIPTHAGRGGHPTIFRWSLFERIASLPPDRGLDLLTRDPALAVERFPCDTPEIRLDLDTPEDYHRAQELWQQETE